MKFNLFEKKEDPVIKEKEERLKRVKDFFVQKRNEWHMSEANIKKSVFDLNKSVPDNFYPKPYAKGINTVALGEAIRELGVGKKESALEILKTMRENARLIDPSWPDIKEMDGIIADIESL